MKKKICLITDWYPTKENPYRGLFFKEQAIALGENYDFLVVRYQEMVSFCPFRGINSELLNEEKNTVEYSLNVFVPIIYYVLDILKTNYVLFTRRGYIDGVGKYVSCRKVKYIKKQLKKVFNEIIKEDFDLLYCVDAQNESFILKCVSEISGKPYILGEHAPVPWPGTVISDVNKHAFEDAKAFLAISNDKIRQVMLQNIKIPKIFYIGNLIDEKMFRPSIKVTKDEKTIMIVAANSFYKNYDMFFAVINRLCELTTRKFKVMIVGYGANKGYSRNIEEFENKIKESSFYDISILIPEVSHSEIYKLYQDVDAFVMTSVQEGQPVSAMEAACCGIPVFSTRCGGVEDYITDEMGRIYDICDVEGMAQGLRQYIEDEISFDSSIIRKNIVDKFGEKAFCLNFEKVVNYATANNVV